jgi:hypothetical protein
MSNNVDYVTSCIINNADQFYLSPVRRQGPFAVPSKPCALQSHRSVGITLTASAYTLLLVLRAPEVSFLRRAELFLTTA